MGMNESLINTMAMWCVGLTGTFYIAGESDGRLMNDKKPISAINMEIYWSCSNDSTENELS